MTGLQAHGITPPAYGGSKAQCPKCIETRRHKGDKSLRVTETPGGWDVFCFHCGWETWLAE